MPTGRAATIITSSVLTTGMVLTGCSIGDPDPPQQSAPVPVGLLAGPVDQTGPAADAVLGAELAVTVVNEAHPGLDLPLAAGTGLPGFGGAPLSLAVADSAGQVDAAEPAMERLLSQEGVAGVVTADHTGVTEVVGPVADRHGVPLVDGATSPGFLLDLGLEWYFRTGPTDRRFIDAIVQLLPAADDSGQPYRLTLLMPADRRGADLAGLLSERAEATGFEVTDRVVAGNGAAERLAAVAPDIVVAIAPDPADGPELHDAVGSWDPPAASAEPDPAPDPAPAGLVIGVGQGFTTRTADDMRPGMLHVSAWSVELAGRQPLAQSVAALHSEVAGEPLSEAGARAFTATLTLALALDTAGTTDALAVRAALRQLSVPATRTIMPWDGIRFGDDGQNELAAVSVEEFTADGVRLLYPPELAIAELSWQPPARGPGIPPPTTEDG